MDKKGNKYTEADVNKITDASGRVKVPFSMELAKHRPDYGEFIKSSKIEWDGIEGHKTFGPDMKISEIRKMGIKQSIVPCREMLQIKEVDGKVEKWKNRLVIQGSQYNCKKGEHYTDTYSPAPNCTTTRILLSLVVQLGLLLLSVDISQAYLWGRMPLHERMPIRMPLHRRKYDKHTGEELYRVLLGSCYGCPQSSRVWGNLRDDWFLSEFNKNGWTCTKSRRDPCLFIFTHSKKSKVKYARAGRYMGIINSYKTSCSEPKEKPPSLREYGFDDPTVDYTLLVVHSDDLDIVGESKADLDYIATRLHDRFKIAYGDP